MGKKQQQKSVTRTTTITPASTTTTLKSFSPWTSSSKSSLPPLYYAHLLRAPDAHTLRVYETSTGKCISRWASNQLGDEDEEHEQRVASLEWTLIPAPLAATSNAESVQQSAEAEGKRGKKRRKSDSTPVAPLAPSVQQQAEPKLVLALGLENGSILLWSPNGANPTTLSHPSSSTPVTALASPIVAGQSSAEATSGHLWSAHEDGSVRVWDLVSGQLMGKANVVTEGKKWDDLAVRYEAAEASDKKRSVQIVLSHLSLHVYSLSILTGASKKDKVKDLKATEVGRCTGHVEAAFVRWTGRSATASSTSAMEEDASTSLSFLSYSPADRFIQFWSLALSSTTSTRAEGSLVARLALDSGVHSVALGASASTEEEQIVAGIDSVGKVALARLPFVFPQATAAKGKKAGVLALEVESEVSGKGGDAAGVSEVAFGAEAQLVVCRGGVKPTFESVVSFPAQRPEDRTLIFLSLHVVLCRRDWIMDHQD